MIALDHAVILVRDLDEAASAWSRLGFTLTPRGHHSRLGTANHTIMFERDYLELLTVVEPNPANAPWRQRLGRGDGLDTVALATSDARALARTLATRGVRAAEPLHFGRPVERPEGGAGEARFTVCFPEAEASPAFPLFFCQHHTPELVWQSRYQRHASSARGLTGVTVVSADPLAAAPAYERLLGHARVHPRPGGITVSCGNADIWLITAAWAAARLEEPLDIVDGPIGATVAVASLDDARRALDAAGIPARPFGRRSVLVDPAHASGVYLELLET